MIYVEPSEVVAAGLNDAAVLVAALVDAGLPAAVLRSSLCGDLGFNAAYDFARHVAPGPVTADDLIFIPNAQAMPDDRLASLRRIAQGGAQSVAAGVFKDLQTELAARARLGYALGREPELFRLSDATGTLLEHTAAPVFGIERGRTPRSDGRLRVLLVDPKIENAVAVRGLQALAASRKLRTTVLTNGKAKTALLAKGAGLPVYHYAEAPPGALVRGTDVAVFFGPLPKGYRLRMLLADMAVSDVGLLDASDGFQLRKFDTAFVPAPADPAALAAFLVSEILPNLGDLERLTAQSRTAGLSRKTRSALAERLDGPDVTPARPKTRNSPDTAGARRVVFMPTNGVGLGHAQRCSLIASSMDRTKTEPVFAAFPSCAKLLKSYGFDVMPLVGKIGLHAEQLANDIVNYTRIDDLVATSSAFVFDGGYVFNSVFRAILGSATPSVWIRRGLWQTGQDNSLALEREKIFDRVIVPREAFEELNAAYSNSDRVVDVGPVVQHTELGTEERAALRASLMDRFGRSFTSLVVTMLGGGVAADNTAQTIALAAMLARRTDTLHLVVVWPTSTVDPGLFGWPNTRVVKTHRAGILAAAADLYVSAAGYNSFHEALYNRIPTIFIPQMAAYMDDQRARAAAAAERGLAILIEPSEIMALESAVTRSLDGGAETLRLQLADCDLPKRGNEAAAKLVSDLAGAPDVPVVDATLRRVA